jgi:hypothetical protein
MARLSFIALLSGHLYVGLPLRAVLSLRGYDARPQKISASQMRTVGAAEYSTCGYQKLGPRAEGPFDRIFKTCDALT